MVGAVQSYSVPESSLPERENISQKLYISLAFWTQLLAVWFRHLTRVLTHLSFISEDMPGSCFPIPTPTSTAFLPHRLRFFSPPPALILQPHALILYGDGQRQ